MLKNQIFTIVFTVLITLIVVFTYSKYDQCAKKTQEIPNRHVKTYRLLDVMHEFQTYSTKFYFAGMAKNKNLAAWYSWKLQSAINSIKEGKIEPYAYNGWDAAELVKMLDMPIANLNTVVKNEQWGSFENQFSTLINTCNACHAVAEHRFVVVKVPTGKSPQNQLFDNNFINQ